MEEDARLVEEPGTMNTERRADTEKVSNTLAAGIKATGGQGEERGEERDLLSDPGGGRALGPPLGGPASASVSASASASSLFAQHQKAALDLYDAIYRQAEVVIGSVDGGPLAQVEALANEIRSLRCRLSATVAERDALMNLVVKPASWGGRWTVNIGRSSTEVSRDDAVGVVRKAAGLAPDPKAEGVESPG
jgi:hypothetical protein